MSLDDANCLSGVLPPNVAGKSCRGILKFSIKNITFCENKFNKIDIKILFWGQKPKEAIQVRYDFNSSAALKAKSVKYEIKTSLNLFKSYLKNCEPIQLQLHSTATNLNIGRVQIPIATQFSNFNEQRDEYSQIVYQKIKSPKGHYFGDITLQIGLLLSQSKLASIPEKEKMLLTEKRPEHFQVHISAGQTNVKPPHVIKPTAQPILTSVSAQRKVLAYLRGDEMTENSEQEILEEICSISPAQSLLNLLEADKKPKVEQNPSNFFLKHIDSTKLTVKRLELSKAGLKEVLFHFPKDGGSLCDVHFVIEAKIWQAHVESVKFNSTRGSSCTVGVINFNQKTIKSLQPPQSSSTFGHITFKVYFRESLDCCNSMPIKYLGEAKIQINEAVNSSFACCKKCPVLLGNENILIGHLIVQLELGTRGLHFGEEMLEAVLYNKENTTVNDSDCMNDSIILDKYRQPMPVYPKKMSCDECFGRYTMCCRQEKCCNNPGGNRGNKNANDQKPVDLKHDTQPASTQSGLSGNVNKATADHDKYDPTNKVEAAKTDEPELRLLHGLLYINAIRNVKSLPDGNYFIVCKGFWNEDATSTEMCQNDVFNFLKTFPVICNEAFLERVRNNHLVLELWQKTQTSAEQLVGVARLPLHQFFIAYRDAAVAARLRETCKLPVISCDGWSNVVSPLSSELCGQVNALLAIGTEEQLEYLKTSRALYRDDGVRSPVIPVPGLLNATARKVIPANGVNGKSRNVSNAQATSDLLGSFLENLAQQLPNRTAAAAVVAAPLHCGKESISSVGTNQAALQMQKTSDLLESLQKALLKPPASLVPSISPQTATHSRESELVDLQIPTRDTASGPEEETFKVIVEVEAAQHLPKLNANKKYTKPRGKAQQQKADIEPHAYVTFEASIEGPTVARANLYKSHEGMVYATNVIETDCNPVWKKRFEVLLPVDMMRNKEKRFILKVWRKKHSDGPNCQPLLPTPMEDAIIGFTPIDLSVLLTGMTPLSGWFNIMDFSGRCNGQLQVHIRPVDDATQFKNPAQSPTLDTMIPLSIDIDGDLTLSRALKRKFVELEEITQRLKARLHDVTGDVDVDPDDEFEHDLNTVAMEDEEGVAVSGEGSTTSDVNTNDYGWLGAYKDPFSVEANQFQEALMQSFERAPAPKVGRSLPSERVVSGCSSTRDLQMASLDNLLRKHDMDSLINPDLFKNLLDPLVSSSSDTSSLMQKTVPAVPSSTESSLCGGGGSSSSKESIQFIENALQNAAISHQQLVEKEANRSSGGGDGESCSGGGV